jgi:hypothetical protein
MAQILKGSWKYFSQIVCFEAKMCAIQKKTLFAFVRKHWDLGALVLRKLSKWLTTKKSLTN